MLEVAQAGNWNVVEKFTVVGKVEKIIPGVLILGRYAEKGGGIDGDFMNTVEGFVAG